MLDKEKITQWINNPSSIDLLGMDELNELINEYPAFTTSYLWRAILNPSSDNIRAAAIRCLDRNKLRSLTQQTFETGTTEQASEPIDFPVATESVNAFDELKDDPLKEGDTWASDDETLSKDEPSSVLEEQEDKIDAHWESSATETDTTSDEPSDDLDAVTNEEIEEETEQIFEKAAENPIWHAPAMPSYASEEEEISSISDDIEEEISVPTDDEEAPQALEGDKSAAEQQINEAEKIADDYSLPDEYSDDTHLYQYTSSGDEEEDTAPVVAENANEEQTAPAIDEVKDEKPPQQNKENDSFREELISSLEELQQTRASMTDEGADEHPPEKPEISDKEEDSGWKDLTPKEDPPAGKKEKEQEEGFADASFFGLNDLLSDEDDDEPPLKKK